MLLFIDDTAKELWASVYKMSLQKATNDARKSDHVFTGDHDTAAKAANRAVVRYSKFVKEQNEVPV